MEKAERARIDIARRVLPTPLFDAITYIFDQGLSKTSLVGGTALSGFYAGHRRSDDIDLFVEDEFSFKAAVRAAQSLSSIGATILRERSSKQYYNGQYRLEDHFFTVDVVIDSNLYKTGSFELTGNIQTADLKTLLSMKSATLISRCSEKDLYDLIWLFGHFSELSLSDLIETGKLIDHGLSEESILISLAGTTLKLESCGFATDKSAKAVYDEISTFKLKLEKEISTFLRSQTKSRLGSLVALARRID